MFLDKTQFEEWMRRIMERLDLLENRMNNRLEHSVEQSLNGHSTPFARKRPEPEIDGERLLDNTDLCFMLNCSKRTLQRLRASGHLPHRRINQKTYYLSSEVRDFIRNHLKPPTGAPGK